MQVVRFFAIASDLRRPAPPGRSAGCHTFRLRVICPRSLTSVALDQRRSVAMEVEGRGGRIPTGTSMSGTLSTERSRGMTRAGDNLGQFDPLTGALQKGPDRTRRIEP